MTCGERVITDQFNAAKELVTSLSYLSPFIALGISGGIIRAVNTKQFTWAELFKRAITGAFAAALAGLYLKNLNYPIETEYAIAGAVGAVAVELITAIKVWIIRMLGGDLLVGQQQEAFDDSGDNSDNPTATAPVDSLKETDNGNNANS